MSHSWGINDDGNYCVVAEERVLETIMMECWPYELRAGCAAQARQNAQRALAGWISQGLPHRQQGDQRLFDICQVMNYVRSTVARRGEWDSPLPDRRRQILDYWPGEPDPPCQGRHDPCRFSIQLGREFNLTGCPPGKPVRLRLPLPLEDATQEDVVLVRTAVSVPAARITQVPGRLEVLVHDPPERVAIDVRVDFTAWCASFRPECPGPAVSPLGSEEKDLYTRPSEGLIQVTPRIARLAETLARPGLSPWQTVQAIWRHLQERIEPGFIHHDEQDPQDRLGGILDRGWADCWHNAALLASLCRARGIPARIIHGLILHPLTPGDHYWLEVFLPECGWVPLDTMGWHLAGGDPASTWLDFYLGRMDYRMKTECLPHAITGMIGVKFPPSWYLIPHLAGETVEEELFTAANTLLYKNRYHVAKA